MKRVLMIFGGVAAASALAVAAQGATRQLSFEGGPRLDIAVPGQVTITQGPVPRLVVSGPRDVVDRVYLQGDRLRYRRSGFVWFGWQNVRGLSVAITVPHLRDLQVHSGTDARLVDLREDALSVSVHSGADLDAQATVRSLSASVHSGADLRMRGRAEKLALTVHSGADADLAALQVDHAQVTAHSGADATVNSRLSVHAAAHSGGDIRLVTRPAQVSSTSHSGGDVRMP